MTKPLSPGCACGRAKKGTPQSRRARLSPGCGHSSFRSQTGCRCAAAGERRTAQGPGRPRADANTLLRPHSNAIPAYRRCPVAVWEETGSARKCVGPGGLSGPQPARRQDTGARRPRDRPTHDAPSPIARNPPRPSAACRQGHAPRTGMRALPGPPVFVRTDRWMPAGRYRPPGSPQADIRLWPPVRDHTVGRPAPSCPRQTAYFPVASCRTQPWGHVGAANRRYRPPAGEGHAQAVCRTRPRMPGTPPLTQTRTPTRERAHNPLRAPGVATLCAARRDTPGLRERTRGQPPRHLPENDARARDPAMRGTSPGDHVVFPDATLHPEQSARTAARKTGNPTKVPE